MTQPPFPGQENSVPPTAWPPQQQAYPAGAPAAPPPPPPPAPAQAYGYNPAPYQQGGYPAGYGPAVPAAPAGPGFFDIDFWIPKMKVIAIIVLGIFCVNGLWYFISGLINTFGYYGTVGSFFSGFTSLLSQLGNGLMYFVLILGFGRVLEYVQERRAEMKESKEGA